jgi:hypothetical protein
MKQLLLFLGCAFVVTLAQQIFGFGISLSRRRCRVEGDLHRAVLFNWFTNPEDVASVRRFDGIFLGATFGPYCALRR